MTWLITGGCGFVGSNLAKALLHKGEDVVILDNLSRLGATDNLAWLRKEHGTEWRFVEADIRDSQTVARLVQEVRPDVVAHLAGQVAMTTSLQNPRLDFEVNALGTLNLLEAVRQHSPTSSVLYSSTNKVYGDLEWVRYEEHQTRYVATDYPHGFDETIPLSFHSPYGCSKGAADQYMLDYARMFGLRTVVFRHSSMYGGRQFATYDQGWIGWFCQQAVATQKARDSGQPAPVFTISGNGKQVRDVLHAEDAIRLYMAAAIHIDQICGIAVNVGGGMTNSLSLLELFSILEESLGVRLKYVQRPWRESDQKIFVADISCIHSKADWEPQVGARAGLGQTVGWIREMSR
ncbi:MAG: SDR family NAD(P)-dependent oxidoreductase [Chloroflexi bacterium]|nr:SDR family NAD(P)-dependent oxidoreductase [Candidatus Marsarchaeota archaeon]MCL5951011.1 SDR family NAD(P)-dependent oxidoreductase [Chloroflexota bacterium]